MDSFRAYRVELEGEAPRGAVTTMSRGSLPVGEVTIEVAYSSLNYKDALSARARPGVTREYPHTPGIDAAGTVIESTSERFRPGQEVIATSYDLGVDTDGGFAELVRVPAEWVLPLPVGLTPREAMIYGTAGLTAALALLALQRHGVQPTAGPLVVTGASGGVGSLTVALLSISGYRVVASTGTEEAKELLHELGADSVIARSELAEPSRRPLLRGSYAGGVDTVGGDSLANLLKSTGYGGAVAACGLVQSPELNVNVYPFILRGVALLGIDSANCPTALRTEAWKLLAERHEPGRLERLVSETTLDGLDAAVDRILAGKTVGRTLVRVLGGR